MLTSCVDAAVEPFVEIVEVGAGAGAEEEAGVEVEGAHRSFARDAEGGGPEAIA